QRQLDVALFPLAAACGSHLHSQTFTVVAAGAEAAARPATQPSARPAVEQRAVEDPVVTLIATSDRYFTLGQQELEQGHFEAAKQAFNRAVDVLLESPYGARTEPQIREHFDRLVDRISTYEVPALAVGDGFAENKYEPASIDELLALSTTFGTPSVTPETTD